MLLDEFFKVLIIDRSANRGSEAAHSPLFILKVQLATLVFCM
jgi:hypothetical protein